jgi:hypothetical protein
MSDPSDSCQARSDFRTCSTYPCSRSPGNWSTEGWLLKKEPPNRSWIHCLQRRRVLVVQRPQSNVAGRASGGTIALDGVHPTTIGYGILAQAILDIIHTFPGFAPGSDIDFAALVSKDTLVSDPSVTATPTGSPPRPASTRVAPINTEPTRCPGQPNVRLKSAFRRTGLLRMPPHHKVC